MTILISETTLENLPACLNFYHNGEILLTYSVYDMPPCVQLKKYTYGSKSWYYCATTSVAAVEASVEATADNKLARRQLENAYARSIAFIAGVHP